MNYIDWLVLSIQPEDDMENEGKKKRIPVLAERPA